MQIKGILHHIHLGRTSYAHANQIQAAIFTAFQNTKPALSPSQSSPFTKILESPNTTTINALTYKPSTAIPTVITFECSRPTYTSGRRQLGKIAPEEKHKLCFPTDGENNPTSSPIAEFYEATRGGQMTFHGPGQLIAYPILDLQIEKDMYGPRARSKPVQLGTKTYVSMIEEVTVGVLEKYGLGGVNSIANVEAVRRCTYPGVWVQDKVSERFLYKVWVQDKVDSERFLYNADTEWKGRKIASVGVHCKRFITSHGIGLNITNEPLWWFNRFSACGIEGVEVTSLEKELGPENFAGVTIEAAARYWVELLGKRLRRRIIEVKLEDVIDLETDSNFQPLWNIFYKISRLFK